MNEQEFVDLLAVWGIVLDAQQRQQFADYAQTLQEWNQRMNLTAVADTETIYRRHFADSLSCAGFWGAAPAALIDIGSGAGFPGVPLKIAFPNLHLVLVESIGKKTAFLTHIVQALKLSDVDVLTARAEDVGRDRNHREQYSVATARAVAQLNALLEYTLPLVCIGGCVLAQKGADIDNEVRAAQQVATLLGGDMPLVEQVDIVGLGPRTIVTSRKIARTSSEYPRAVGVPTRHPLGEHFDQP